MGEVKASVARVCVPVCEGQATDLRRAIARAAEAADFVELRLDYLQGDELFRALPNLPALIRASRRPVIITLRPVEQGGRREMSNLTRMVVWVEHFLNDEPHVDFADIELDLALHFLQREKEEGRAILNWERVICSHHDFTGVPSTLEGIYKQMAGTPARILKIAVRAADATDCIPVFNLLERAQAESREMIAVAMGEAGIATRILGPARGGFLTYATLDERSASAPGQLSVEELHELYRIQNLTRETAVMGVVGSPVSHSLSPHMHNAALETLGINGVFIPFEVRDARAFLRRMVIARTREVDLNLRGLSITAPHKTAVIEHLDWIDTAALAIGAVNTIVVEKDSLQGYNTDAAGFLAPLKERRVELKGARAAVIGAGGAARGVLWALLREGARPALFVRDFEKARPLIEAFGVECELLEGARFDGFELVVNATPLGTRGALEDETPALENELRGARLVYDLVYNPRETRFLREARAAGCDTIGGLPMLVAQAAEQFRLWTGREAPVGVMNNAALGKVVKQTFKSQDELSVQDTRQS